jgi:hypothetical protein
MRAHQADHVSQQTKYFAQQSKGHAGPICQIVFLSELESIFKPSAIHLQPLRAFSFEN